MSLSDDSYDFEYYGLEFYEDRSGPPLIKKRSRLIATVVQNDVEGLKELLDSPKWYNVKDHWGYTLLQIAIYRENKEVFDYMLSLDDFPVDAVSRDGETPLQIALTSYVSNDIFIDGYYAYELLKKDVSIDFVSKEGETSYAGETFLHCAFERGFIPAARLLIEKGADLNAQTDEGATPLSYCIGYCEDDDIVEGVTMLLCHGADPFVQNTNGEVAFDYALHHGGNIGLAQEILFYYTFDEYSCRTISLHSLLEGAQNKLPFFYELIEKISTVNCNNCTCFNMTVLFTVELQYLKVLLEKFSYAFEDFFLNCANRVLFQYANFSEQSLQNIDMLINNSELGSAVIEIICDMDSSELINSLINKGLLSLVSEIVCYFLSYGMTIKAEDFHLVYKKFGFCELFKILLQMDVKEYKLENAEIIPALFYNVEIYNVETYLQDPYKFSTDGVEELLSYSAHPKLKEFCHTLDQESLIEKAKNLPDIPLLIELARDIFREYFIKKFNIKASKQFHMMLKMLPISDIHRKFITFETKLYY